MSALRIASLGMLVLVLTACGGGTRLVRNAPPPAIPEAPLAQANDSRLAGDIRFVIVRNGPGAWAKNGDWDEYLLQVRNTSDAPITVTAALLTDSLGYAAGNLGERKALVIGSRKTAKRYRDQGIRVMAGRGGGTLVAIGAGLGNAGYAAGWYALAGAGEGVAAGALGMMAAAPVVIGVGITRAVRNSKVNKRVGQRSSSLPLTLAPGASADLDLFFPISPSPTRLELVYRDDDGEHTLAFDLRSSFAGLHLPAAEVPQAATQP